MLGKLCEPEHLILIVLVLLVALLMVGSGKGLGGLVGLFLKKLGLGKDAEVIVNIDGGEMAKKPNNMAECAACGLMVDPTKCIMHASEHERSIRNEEQIKKIWAEYGKLRDETLAGQAKIKDEMVAGFEKVNASINQSNTQILSALAKGGKR